MKKEQSHWLIELLEDSLLGDSPEATKTYRVPTNLAVGISGVDVRRAPEFIGSAIVELAEQMKKSQAGQSMSGPMRIVEILTKAAWTNEGMSQEVATIVKSALSPDEFYSLTKSCFSRNRYLLDCDPVAVVSWCNHSSLTLSTQAQLVGAYIDSLLAQTPVLDDGSVIADSHRTVIRVCEAIIEFGKIANINSEKEIAHRKITDDLRVIESAAHLINEFDFLENEIRALASSKKIKLKSFLPSYYSVCSSLLSQCLLAPVDVTIGTDEKSRKEFQGLLIDIFLEHGSVVMPIGAFKEFYMLIKPNDKFGKSLTQQICAIDTVGIAFQQALDIIDSRCDGLTQYLGFTPVIGAGFKDSNVSADSWHPLVTGVRFGYSQQNEGETFIEYSILPTIEATKGSVLIGGSVPSSKQPRTRCNLPYLQEVEFDLQKLIDDTLRMTGYEIFKGRLQINTDGNTPQNGHVVIADPNLNILIEVLAPPKAVLKHLGGFRFRCLNKQELFRYCDNTYIASVEGLTVNIKKRNGGVYFLNGAGLIAESFSMRPMRSAKLAEVSEGYLGRVDEQIKNQFVELARRYMDMSNVLSLPTCGGFG